MATLKLKFSEIQAIHAALSALGQREVRGLTYELAKNLRATARVTSEIQEAANELYKRYAEKDSEGRFVVFKDAQGNDIAKITDPAKAQEHYQELQKLQADLFELKIHRILRSRLKEDVPAAYLAPLLETVFVESEEELHAD